MDWIKCSEQLPAEDGFYLTSDADGYVQIYPFADGWNCYRKCDGTIGRDFECNPGKIIAWMPLPAPYKEGEDGNI